MFVEDDDSRALKHATTQTRPLFLHVPGKFYACLDRVVNLAQTHRIGKHEAKNHHHEIWHPSKNATAIHQKDSVASKLIKEGAVIKKEIGSAVKAAIGSVFHKAQEEQKHNVRGVSLLSSKRSTTLDRHTFTCERDIDHHSLEEVRAAKLDKTKVSLEAMPHSHVVGHQEQWTEVKDHSTQWVYWWNQRTNEIRDEQGRSHWWDPTTETAAKGM